MYQYTAKIKKIGELLKEKRKEKGLDFPQISDVIKVRIEYLKALEEASYDTFASEVQLKGFLNKYAGFLGIPEDKASAMYRREREGLKDERVIRSPVESKTEMGFVLTPSKLVAAVIAGTIIAVLIYIGTQLNEIIKPPNLTVKSPVTLSSGNEGTFTTDSKSVVITGDIEVGATLSVNGTKVTTNNLQKYQIENLNLSKGENKFVLVAESQFGRKSEITLNILLRSSQETVRIDGRIIANKRVDIRITTDGQEIFNSALNAGEPLDFTANSIAEVSSLDLADLSIEVNGEKQETGNSTSQIWEVKNGVIEKR
ncbi:helix-turn-helix domain-containing protein [Candidatus Dojkabacteria bacterium]|nr:helix-turn-helix domain-containing protein [Candidatus Dojkabacteria bacterium]